MVQHGYWHARSLEAIGSHRSLLFEWLRLPGDVVFIVCDDGWKYLSSGIYTRPLEEIENLDATVWW